MLAAEIAVSSGKGHGSCIRRDRQINEASKLALILKNPITVTDNTGRSAECRPQCKQGEQFSSLSSHILKLPVNAYPQQLITRFPVGKGHLDVHR